MESEYNKNVRENNIKKEVITSPYSNRYDVDTCSNEWPCMTLPEKSEQIKRENDNRVFIAGNVNKVLDLGEIKIDNGYLTDSEMKGVIKFGKSYYW